MNADIEYAGRFLEALAATVARMDDWGYSIALRYNGYDRAHGAARMVRGGHLGVSCGFHVARETAREISFAIVFTRHPDRWTLTVEVDDEDEERSRFRWESLPIAATSLAELSSAIDQAFGVLDRSIQIPEVAATLEIIRGKKT